MADISAQRFAERGEGEADSSVPTDQEKRTAKSEMEGEIARLWESVGIAEKEREGFAAQVMDLRAKLAADEAGDALVNGERIKALREYEGLLAEVDRQLERDRPALKRLEAQYQTVFGPPIVH